MLDSDAESSDYYKWGFSLVSKWSSHLSLDDCVVWDISPNRIGNILNTFPTSLDQFPNFYNEQDGGDYGVGYDINPHTQEAYEEQNVLRGDYTRVLAEFWADGPD